MIVLFVPQYIRHIKPLMLGEPASVSLSVREGQRAGRNPRSPELLKAAEELETKLKDLAEMLNPPPVKQGMADLFL